MLRDCPNGGYRFLPGIPAFSSGVIASPGWEIVRATLAAPLPWQEGFQRVDRHLREQGRPRAALCGIELRSPAPFTFEGFARFNNGYQALLKDWGIRSWSRAPARWPTGPAAPRASCVTARPRPRPWRRRRGS